MKYIAIDLGTKTMGIATSENGFIASPRETFYFPENNFNVAIEYLSNLINNEKFGILVVGYPKNMDNSLKNNKVKMVKKFIYKLKNKINNEVQVELQDERLTTKMANDIMLEANLSRKKRKQKKDTLAAQIILTIYLDKKGNKIDSKKN